MADNTEQLDAALAERRAAHLYRQNLCITETAGAQVRLNNSWKTCFCSNDYLGLKQHPQLQVALQTASLQYGVGSGSAHLICGHSQEHQLLEQQFASLLGYERALVFSTGYMANMAIISALVGKGDQVFADKLSHASLLDGVTLSGARLHRYLHNDIASLQGKLAKAGTGRKLICTEGIFSMDGDIAALPEISALAQQYNALLLVDDAHAIGSLGARGLGSCEHFQLSSQQVPIVMATLGKALGSFGAIVASSNTIIDTIIQFGRPYIYTTAIPSALACVARSALHLSVNGQHRRTKLAQLISYFTSQAQQLNIKLMPSATAIQPLALGDDALALQYQNALYDMGYLVSAIRYPTVPRNSARLRITLSYEHSQQDIDQLLRALASIAQSLAV